ncbi:MAG: ABC-2 family transporter protein [Candidatus Micrarchaeota archaeon]|nr:ABC-2 family transporter protein [Candidatus Micrarchaeota archaeon]
MNGARLVYISQLYSFKIAMVYRAQFALTILDTFVGMILPIAFITIMYNVSQGISGWSFYQLLLLVGLVDFATIVVYYANPARINNVLRLGYFDTYLTKPQSPILMLLTKTEGMWSFFFGMWSIIVIAFACANLSFSMMNLAPFIITVLGGVVTFMLFTAFTGIASYRIFSQANSQNWLMSNILSFGQYPLKIYGNIGAIIFTFAAPIALASFYPASLLLGKIGILYFFAIFGLEVALSAVFLKASETLLKGYTSASG